LGFGSIKSSGIFGRTTEVFEEYLSQQNCPTMNWKDPEFRTYFLKRSLGFVVACLAFDLFLGKRNLLTLGLEQLLISLAMYAAGGVIYGLLAWRFRERSRTNL
jgi:hypothetical protein